MERADSASPQWCLSELLRESFAPRSVVGLQPGKQVEVLRLRERPRQSLIEMIMRIDETGDNTTGRQFACSRP